MRKTSFILPLFAASTLSLFSSISAFAGSLVIEVLDDSQPTTETIAYQCNIGTGTERVEATYHNAGDISLVDFKWKDHRVVGANVIAASGAKYMGAQYVWWTSKNEATLYDLINDPQQEKPILCVEEKEK
ncbi:MliC family protein [Bartonella sp. B30(2025)]